MSKLANSLEQANNAMHQQTYHTWCTPNIDIYVWVVKRVTACAQALQTAKKQHVAWSLPTMDYYKDMYTSVHHPVASQRYIHPVSTESKVLDFTKLTQYNG